MSICQVLHVLLGLSRYCPVLSCSETSRLLEELQHGATLLDAPRPAKKENPVLPTGLKTRMANLKEINSMETSKEFNAWIGF